MKALFTICLCFSLTACATDQFESRRLKNGCAIDAVSKQHALKAKAVCDKREIWSRILVVHFYQEEILKGHVYCIFEDSSGLLWAYDWSGSKPLNKIPRDPLYIAARLRSNVQHAYFTDTL
jgi:hypothetical protein